MSISLRHLAGLAVPAVVGALTLPACKGAVSFELETPTTEAKGRTSCPELTAACDVPSVTRRVCDLIAAGWPIARTRGRVRTKRGAWRRATFYELTGPHAQGDLFGNPAE